MIDVCFNQVVRVCKIQKTGINVKDGYDFGDSGLDWLSLHTFEKESRIILFHSVLKALLKRHF